MKPPPVHLTDKTRELLRLLASDPVMREALWLPQGVPEDPAAAMLRVSRMDEGEWGLLEDKFR